MSYKSGPRYLNLSEYVSGEKSCNPENPENKQENYGSFSISAAVRYPFNASYYGLAPQPHLAGVT